MKNIKVKNTLPDLLEAVCQHKDCPDWLSDGIWDLVNDQPSSTVFTSSYWQYAFDAIEERRQRREEPETPKSSNVLNFSSGNQCSH